MVSHTKIDLSENLFFIHIILELLCWVSHQKLRRFAFINRHKCAYLTVNKYGKCNIFQAGTIIKNDKHYSAK